MKSIIEIYKHTFKYKTLALLVIVFNFLFVVFNLISMVLFIPFLQLIFPTNGEQISIPEKPIYDGSISGMVHYVSEYYSYFTQSMVAENPKNALLFVCFSVLVAFFLKNVFRYIAIWHQSQLRMVVVRDVRQNLFDKAMSLPLSFYSNERKGDLMSRIQSDVGEIEIAVIAVLELIFREPIAVIINIAALLYWSPKLTLFSFILLPITAFVISRIGKSLKRTAGQERIELGVLFSKMEEALGGIRIIKAFNAQKFIKDSFAKTNLRHQQLTTKAFRKRDLSPPLNEFLAVVVMLGIVWYGGSMILDNSDTNGFDGPQFIGFILVFSQLLRPIQGIATSIANLNKAQAAQERINEVLNTDEKIHENSDALETIQLSEGIHYKNVSFSYNEEPVLKNVSFSIPKGKTIALVGESGSGKSTISDLLPRFYDVTQGEITIDNTDIRAIKINELRNKIGIVSQESILFNGTVAENIAFGKPTATREEIIEAAKIANAHKFIQELENGYDTQIGERGNKLSGGQKQRVSIARAVLKNPDILILDEATSALDTESEKLVQEALNKLMTDRTSLVIAHRLSTIVDADEIIVLSKGEIIERGTHAELLAKGGTYAYLSSLQGIS
ncbi:MAG: ABC transporter ATP-binding protein/permease [Crocinitomicaceae bacterium]|nr:ABC transporter ATP-binding protein/permease [Crocinitomicaceae bacterium]